MVIIGGLIMVFGLVDLIGSWTSFDLWGSMGVQLPEVLWKFSAYIEIAIGFILFKIGRSKAADQQP